LLIIKQNTYLDSRKNTRTVCSGPLSIRRGGVWSPLPLNFSALRQRQWCQPCSTCF